VDEYRRLVSRLAGAGGPETLAVRSPDHAAVVIGQLFAVAQDRVRVLSSELPLATFGTPEVIGAAVKYLTSQANARLKILVEQAVSLTQHPLLVEIAKQGLSERLDLLVVPPSVSRNYTFNFVVADETNFRFEPVREKFEAMVCFGQPDLARKIKGMFDKIEAQAQPVTPTLLDP
jgi:hypothetical protein